MAKITLKRSLVVDAGIAREPTAAQMDYGEVAINYSEEDPALFIKNSSNEIIRLAGIGAVGSGSEVIIQDTAPETDSLLEGTLWWDSDETSGQLFVLYNDPDDGFTWIEASPTSASNDGGARVEISDTAPNVADFEEGDLWFNSDDGRLYILYRSNNGVSTWIDASPDGGLGGGGAGITVSDTAPTDDVQGSLWWNTNDNTLYVWYVDASNDGQWVTSVPQNNQRDLQQVTDAGNNTTNNITLGTDKITLNATNGNATFTGNVTVNNDSFIVASERTNSAFAHINLVSTEFGDPAINANSVFQVAAAGSVKTRGPLLLGGNQSVDNCNAQINSDGSAEFKGDVRMASKAGSTFNFETSSLPDDFMVYPDGSNFNFRGSVSTRFNNYSSLNDQLTGDDNRWTGSTYFNAIDNASKKQTCILVKSAITTNGVYSGGDTRAAIYPNGDALFLGTVTVNGNRPLILALEPDNDANYTVTTDVDEESNTVENRVYNGPTLDVKDRLTKADNALIALKAAATAATDFVELKAAITTALADI